MADKMAQKNKSGAVLLVVLFIVMAITVMSFGYLSRSDTELACGENVVLRAKMDYLALSGLEHAKGMLMSPQEVSGRYWGGGTAQQLDAGSEDFYDVNVVKVGECDYRINCDAYRQRDGERVGASRLGAMLRLDPCIGYWNYDGLDIPSKMTVRGDVYSKSSLVVSGKVYGDVYSMGSITNLGTVTGDIEDYVSAAVIGPAPVSASNFSSGYYYEGNYYNVGIIGGSLTGPVTFGPTASNPKGVYYRSGDLDVTGKVVIDGSLVVSHNLRIKGSGDLSITSRKDFPALLVDNDLSIDDSNQKLTVKGLAQLGHHIDLKGKTGVSVNILGGLYILGDGIKNLSLFSDVAVEASADYAAIEYWSSSSDVVRWSPAAGAFFKSIERR